MIEPLPDINLSALRSIARTGVIYVTTEAEKMGFRADHPDWCNLGQGMPEVGQIEGAPERITQLTLSENQHEYGSVTGLPDLKQAIAELYNHRYRRGMPSQYSAANVAISSGGRTALSRMIASLGHINLGHFLPDYTAYTELLEIFRLISPIPILWEREFGNTFTVDSLRREITGRGLSALLLSNPCNPTGSVIGGEDLRAWVDCVRDLDCTTVFDEFYAHYIWNEKFLRESGGNSAAQYVEDVNQDPVVILDGLTKNWRYPGWRIAWTLGPKRVVEAVGSVGSFLDGGANHPLQSSAVEVVNVENTLAEATAIRTHFRPKRDFLVNQLREMGFLVDYVPDGGFYVWASLENLPASINEGTTFFRAALGYQVIVVPGQFFDVDPGNRRGNRWSQFENYARFSFGPSMGKLELAMARLKQMINNKKGEQ